MKKTLLLSAMGLMTLGASAQIAIEQPSFSQNWSIGLNGGVTTPLVHSPFFENMRGTFGATLAKQITPTFGLGVEGNASVNTSSWYGPHSATAIDGSYVGAFGTVDLMNLFGGYQGQARPFTIAALAGAGWGHQYWTEKERKDHNYMAAKAGLNFNFNVSDDATIYLQPAVVWDLSDANVKQTSAAYDARNATFNLTAGVNFNLGGRQFNPVVPMDPALVDALNAQVNALRADLDASAAANAVALQQIADLNYQLQQKPTVVETTEVVTEVNNYLNSVRYVFFKIGSSVITADQMPNVEMIAAYMKNHPSSTVVIKGYASKDGPEELNIRLANARAESVRNALIKKYNVPASRIKAEGEGIGNMFEEESWNRVSICTIENND
ncbi:MAG: OmpA family protein [Muribaculaceae bacterium]|nr:OmpA family protein [Muribaculaceae bacterium]